MLFQHVEHPGSCVSLTDEAMVVALSVGVCLDGGVGRRRTLLEGLFEKGSLDPDLGFRPFPATHKALPTTGKGC